MDKGGRSYIGAKFPRLVGPKREKDGGGTRRSWETAITGEKGEKGG